MAVTRRESESFFLSHADSIAKMVSKPSGFSIPFDASGLCVRYRLRTIYHCPVVTRLMHPWKS